MNRRSADGSGGAGLIGIVVGAALLAGCATFPKIDWQARVGEYTYDQAVVDFGPPDKYAKLDNGTVVAEWLIRRGHSYAYPAFAYTPYYGPYGYAPFPYGGGYVMSSSPDYFLRLIFDGEARLAGWKQFIR